MPIINVTLAQGRTPEQLRALISALTNAAMESIQASKSSVRVILNEVPRTHFAAGDETLAERDMGRNTQ
ncbi:MAG: 4-oxalocrotonate tautomerase family protein [Propionibacteriaceae bacterium]|nr:4-oxalocrotonate tautomerase family protein [Propionibacteriaceae bacterium]MCL2483759.1 4-oxalocrotonate tautomerase family protein [Propionibacteriaceae bacterium]